jgi:hypothetical protein
LDIGFKKIGADADRFRECRYGILRALEVFAAVRDRYDWANSLSGHRERGGQNNNGGIFFHRKNSAGYELGLIPVH